MPNDTTLSPCASSGCHLPVRPRVGTLANAEHDRDVRAVHVGVEQADPRAGETQRDGDVDGDRGLADPALAGADRDRVANAGDLLASRQSARGAHVGVPADLDPCDRRHHADHRRLDVVADAILERARRRREHNSDRRDAAVDGEVAQHPELQHRLVQLGIDDGRERALEGVKRRWITHLRSSIPRGHAPKRRRSARALPCTGIDALSTMRPGMLDRRVIRDLEGQVAASHVYTRPADLAAYAYDAWGASGERHLPDAVVFPAIDRGSRRGRQRLCRAPSPDRPSRCRHRLRGRGLAVARRRDPQPGAAQPGPRRRIRGACASTPQAGAITAGIHAQAAAAGLYYPPDPGSSATCTIGGNVACNAAGPHTLRYGVTADYVAGITAVLSDGRIVRLGEGGDASAAGLLSLLVGSEGTLGVITEVLLRLIPAPETRSTLAATFTGMERCRSGRRRDQRRRASSRRRSSSSTPRALAAVRRGRRRGHRRRRRGAAHRRARG